MLLAAALHSVWVAGARCSAALLGLAAGNSAPTPTASSGLSTRCASSPASSDGRDFTFVDRCDRAAWSSKGGEDVVGQCQSRFIAGL